MPDLSDLRPCSESWDGMAPLGGGRRLCARCERPVADFRGMSREEITLAHVLSDEPVCGVYTPDQLRPAPEPRRCRSPLVTLALGASLLAARAEAQSAAPAPSEQAQLPRGEARPNDDPHPAAAVAPQDDTLRVHGRVRTKEGAPIRGAVVLIEGTQVRAMTDSAGGFLLRVPADHPREMRLRAGTIAYLPRTVPVHLTGRITEVDVVLDQEAIILVGLVATVVTPEHHQKRREGFSVSRISLGDR